MVLVNVKLVIVKHAHPQMDQCVMFANQDMSGKSLKKDVKYQF